MLALILYIKFLESKRLIKLLVSFICSFYIAYRFHLLVGLKNCPDCYGSELCRSFQIGEIDFTWFSSFLTFFNPNLTKGVFYGVLNGSQVVVKRKLERTEEKLSFGNANAENSLKENWLNPDKVQNVILCPSLSDLGFLFIQIEDQVESKRLWLDLKSSIEPLLLLLFQSDGGWPVPRYHGACGDLIVEEYKGKPLTNFISTEFEIRVALAIHLLKMAHKFTFGHFTYSFYFTDYSLDNLVVDSTYNVFLIDLDNVIISNKVNFSSNQSIHTSQILDEFGYAFSPSDICSHYISDHNYFSVCKFLLSDSKNGLLREIPNKISGKVKLVYLLNECIEPKTMTRFSAGRELTVILEEILNHYKYVQ